MVFLQTQFLRDVAVDGVGGDVLLSDVILLELVQRNELPRARRVVHDRQEAHVAGRGDRFQIRNRVGTRQFAADVNVVRGPKQAAIAGIMDGGGKRAGRMYLAIARVEPACPQGIEYRCDARRDNLGVMGEQGRQHRPCHARTRVQVRLEMIRVKFDKARQQEVAVNVLAAAPGSAGGDTGDHSVPDGKVAFDDLIRQHDAGVAQTSSFDGAFSGGPVGVCLPSGKRFTAWKGAPGTASRNRHRLSITSGRLTVCAKCRHAATERSNNFRARHLRQREMKPELIEDVRIAPVRQQLFLLFVQSCGATPFDLGCPKGRPKTVQGLYTGCGKVETSADARVGTSARKPASVDRVSVPAGTASSALARPATAA